MKKEINNKPKIKKGNYGLWYCGRSIGPIGTGYSPKYAFNDWKDNLHRILQIRRNLILDSLHMLRRSKHPCPEKQITEQFLLNQLAEFDRINPEALCKKDRSTQ